MNDTPLFSIIIPVYNAEGAIIRSLDSLIRQTYKDFEVVMVNDGSKDRSERVILDYLAANPSFNARLLNQQNSGAGTARNVGIRHSNGEYIVFLDSDDYLEDNYLECVFEKIQNDNADVIFVDIIRETESGTIIRRENMSRFSSLNKDQLIRWQLTGKVPWGGWRKVVRASIIKENDLHYAPIKVGEESIFSFRIIDMAQNISFQPSAIYHYVESNTSLTSHDNPANSLEVYNFIRNSLEQLGKLELYQSTVNAIAVNAAVVVINVITLDKNKNNKYREAKHYLSYFYKEINGAIDIKSLERRVQFCIPFVKLRTPLPIMLASYLQNLIRNFK